jgi:hypothetical protein
MDRRKTLRIVAPVLMAGIALVAALAAAEIYVRYASKAGYYTPEIMRKRSLEYEPAVFARHVLLRQEKYVTDKKGNEVRYRINKHGYRGADFDFAKAPGTTRIIFYGGSSVFDLESYDQDWPHRVESALKNVGFQQIEVINAGIPHHATFDAFGRFFAEGHLLDPDYVVLYDAWNDIKMFPSSEPILRSVRPYDDRLDPRMSYRSVVDRKLCEWSQVYVRLRQKYYAWRLKAGEEGKKQEGERASEFGEIGPTQYRVDTEMFIDLARNIGAVPILVTEARLVRRDNTPAEKKRIGYEHQLLTHEALCLAFERCDDIMRSVAREKGAYLIDAATAFANKGDLFDDHVHVTPEGSRQLARFVAEQLTPILREHAKDPATSDDDAGGVSSGGR